MMEYKTLGCHSDADTITRNLNGQGQYGWRLVEAVYVEHGNVILIMARPKRS